MSVCVRAGYPESETLYVEISDDGCGFEAESASRGRGLPNMKTRAALLGAELRFARLEPGTRIELRVAIPG